MGQKTGPAPEMRMWVLIAGLLEIYGQPPTVREIAAFYGCSAPFAMRAVQELEEKRLIFREEGSIVAVRKVPRK